MRTALITLSSLAVLACSSSTDSNPPPSSDVVIVSGAATKGANAYDPDTFTISLATQTSVKWGNGDGTIHTVTADGGEFDSNNLSAGDSFSHIFTTVGSYPYHCKIHPTMTGTIIVTP